MKPQILTQDQEIAVERFSNLCSIGLFGEGKSESTTHFTLGTSIIRVDMEDNGAHYVLSVSQVFSTAYREELFRCAFIHGGYTKFVQEGNIDLPLVMEWIETLRYDATIIEGFRGLKRSLTLVHSA